MNFKDAFNKYKENCASEEEKKYVEEELEKAALISDYLYDTSELDSRAIEISSEIEPEGLANINKKLKKRNIRLIGTSVISVFLLVLVFNYLLKPIINSLYYNPLKNSYSSVNTDMEISVEALTRLHSPDVKFSGIDIENTGIGDYSFTLHLGDSLTLEPKNIIGKLEKGKLTSSEGLFTSPFPTNFLRGRYTGVNIDEYVKDDYIKTLDYLNKLPSYITAKAYVSFENDISMEDLEELYQQYSHDGLQFYWAGIRSSSEKEQPYPLIGIDLYGSANSYDNINQQYDYFDLWKGLVDNKASLAKAYEEHFKALLSFQLDHLDFLRTLEDGINYEEYYKGISSYIEENGLKSYGIVVIGTGEDILKLSEEDNIIRIHIQDLELSTSTNNY